LIAADFGEGQTLEADAAKVAAVGVMARKIWPNWRATM
jgi:hypothetical protein